MTAAKSAAGLGFPLRLVAVFIVLSGLLAGLLAMHAGAGAHGPAEISGNGPVSAAGTAVVGLTPLGAMAASGIEDGSGGVGHCAETCEAPCAFMAATCLLLVVTALLLIAAAALPALYYRLIESGGSALSALGTIASPNRSLSLTALSISRT